MYIVVNCPRCGDYMLAKTVNKTRMCPNCGRRSEIGTLKVIGRADSPKEAVALIQSFKERKFRKR